MNALRRVSVALVAGLALTGAGVTNATAASASAATYVGSHTDAFGSATGQASAAAAGWCPTAIPVVPKKGSLKNVSTIGIGVFHLADGACAQGNYDVVLPVNQDTFHYEKIKWSEVAGAYVGSGYKATVTSGQRTYTYTGPAWIMDPYAYGGNWQIKVVKI